MFLELAILGPTSGTVLAILGTGVGLVGAAIGVYFGLMNEKSPQRRTFLVKLTILLSLYLAVMIVATLYTPPLSTRGADVLGAPRNVPRPILAPLEPRAAPGIRPSIGQRRASG